MYNRHKFLDLDYFSSLNFSLFREFLETVAQKLFLFAGICVKRTRWVPV
jgi:hypothetical protein